MKETHSMVFHPDLNKHWIKKTRYKINNAKMPKDKLSYCSTTCQLTKANCNDLAYEGGLYSVAYTDVVQLFCIAAGLVRTSNDVLSAY